MSNFKNDLDSIFKIDLEEVENSLTLNKEEIFNFSEKFNFSPKAARNWLEKELKNTNSNRVINKPISRFEQGKLYIFKYEASTSDKLSYWDKHPIAIIFGSLETSTGKVWIGVNLSWYPIKARLYFLRKITSIYKNKFKEAIKNSNGNAMNQKPIVFDLYMLKNLLDDKGFSFAIRAYKFENIRQPISCVCYEDWQFASRLDLPPFYPELKTKDGYSIFKIYLDFIEHIKYVIANKGDRLKKMNENKLKGKYNFKR